MNLGGNCHRWLQVFDQPVSYQHRSHRFIVASVDQTDRVDWAHVGCILYTVDEVLVQIR